MGWGESSCYSRAIISYDPNVIDLEIHGSGRVVGPLKSTYLVLREGLRRAKTPLGDGIKINRHGRPGGWRHKSFAIVIACGDGGAHYLKPIGASVAFDVKGNSYVIGKIGGAGAQGTG